MKVRSKTYWLPKRGNSDEEYEDAAFPSEDLETETSGEYKCAVADGATEASFSRRWAQLLVQGYNEDTELTELAERWSQEIKEMELPWYAQEKAEAGAFATLACLKLTPEGTAGGSYWSRALGDSCILHIREEKLISAFPLSTFESFNNSPALLCSNLSTHQDVDSMFTIKEGEWQNGDLFLLLTDAIAAWTFKREEENGDGIKTLLAIKDQEELTKLCREAREAHDEEGRPDMRNDDVTVIAVEVSA